MSRPSALSLSVLVAGCLVTGTLAACSGPARNPAAPSSSTSATQAGASPDDDQPGRFACGKVVRAAREGTLMNPNVVTDINKAAATADAPIADAAQRLADLHRKAVTAHNTDAEPDAIAAVSAGAAELVKICGDSGLETVG